MIEKCGKCGFENKEGSLFCQKCGSQLITKDVSFIQKIQGGTLLKKTFWALTLVVVVIMLIWLSPKNDSIKSTSYTAVSPTSDPDPIIDCQFRNLPWQKMKSSECATSYECPVDDKWIIYKSQEECSAAQNDPNLLTMCPFKYLPSHIMKKSECEKAVECQIGGKWYVYFSQSQCTQYQSLEVSNDWSKYRAARIQDLKAALKITEDQIEYYKNELEKTTKEYEQIVSLYRAGERTKSEFETVSKYFIETDNFIRATLIELAKEADAYDSLIFRFQNGENVTPEEEKAIVGH